MKKTARIQGEKKTGEGHQGKKIKKPIDAKKQDKGESVEECKKKREGQAR